jgi:LacI family transcriptional regulator
MCRCQRSETGLVCYGRLTLPMTAGVSEVLVDHGVSVFLCATNNDPRLAKLHLEALLDKQVDGIIFTATRLDSTPPVDLLNLPIPVVYVFAIAPRTAWFSSPTMFRAPAWRQNTL